MIVENVNESYLFQCARCTARWTESYAVSQVTDEGLIRSFYRHLGGAPCEAPFAAGNVTCPNCGGTKVRKDPRYDEIPTGDHVLFAGSAPGVPEQRAPGDVPVARSRRGVPGTWHRFKFSAVVTLDAGGKAGRQYRCGVPGLLVRVRSCERPSVQQYFPALFFTDDRGPLRPGDKGVRVTVCVPDDDASGFFQSGQHFVMWDGGDIGHGTVAHRLFFSWPELG